MTSTPPNDRHRPTPEFRDALEQNIVLAYRRQQSASPIRRLLATRRMRSAATLCAGIALGVGAEMASAQVQSARQRDELSAVVNAERQLAQLRLEMTQTALKDANQAVAVGARSRDALMTAELDARVAEVNLRRLDLKLEEIRASGAAVSDELWAPLVNKRDFVSERLKLDAEIAQRRLIVLSARLPEAERSVRVGATSDLALLDAQLDLHVAQRALADIVQRLELRRQFLADKTTGAVIAGKAQVLDVKAGIERVRLQLDLARRRLDLVQRRNAVGAAEQLDVKRAEVDVLERTVELQRLEQQLQALLSRKNPS